MTTVPTTADASLAAGSNLSMPQAAERIGISRRLLERHAALGNVRVLRFGRRVVVAAEEVARVAAAGLPSLPRTGH